MEMKQKTRTMHSAGFKVINCMFKLFNQHDFLAT